MTEYASTLAAPPRVVILAAGQGLRWQVGITQRLAGGAEQDATLTVKNKLLVDIGGQPLLHRTLALLAEAGHASPLVYGALTELPADVNSFMPALPPQGIVAALGACHDQWCSAASVLFVLGDVVWSRAAITRMLAPPALDWQFFGKLSGNVFTAKAWPEIYALRVQVAAYPHLLQAVEQLQSQTAWRKKLWELYRVLLALPVPQQPPDQGYLFHPPSSSHFCVVPDWTDDLDDFNEYLAMQQFLSQQPQALHSD